MGEPHFYNSFYYEIPIIQKTFRISNFVRALPYWKATVALSLSEHANVYPYTPEI